jgi:hypothetical protein
MIFGIILLVYTSQHTPEKGVKQTQLPAIAGAPLQSLSRYLY